MELALKLGPMEYIDHIYKNNLEGYAQIAHIENGDINTRNYRNVSLKDIANEYVGLEDIFITPNTTYNGRRLVNNIRQLRALYIDIDNRKWSFNDIVYEVWELANKGKIPKPTMVINSGRGVHLYWRIEHAPYQALAVWQELEDYLYQELKYIGADKKATDAVRILRLPGTINSKNGAKCQIVFMDEEVTYSMYKLRETYLDYKQIIHKSNKKTKGKISNLFTSYSLHIARCEDILTLCEMRRYNVKGCRNMLLHCYAYWLGVTTRDTKILEEQVVALNNKFIIPLKESELRAILRCVPKAIDSFIGYEQGLRTGQAKRVSKGMRDKGGYWYTNETLIDRMNITLDEQKELKTIISREERNIRRNDTRKKNRRNENGLTKREQGKEDKIRKVKSLLEKGLGAKAIAKKLKIAVGTVSGIKNNKY